MTKIKDLAVIAVENAFAMFPIDAERYELHTCLGHFLDCPDIYRDDFRLLPTGDPRIREWIRETDGRFLLCAQSFWTAQHSRKSYLLSSLGFDRARRCEATLRFWCEDERWTSLSVVGPDVLQHKLWEAVARCMRITDVFFPLRSSEGHGGST
jgi:hypothetical protein